MQALFAALQHNTVCKTLYSSGHSISLKATGQLASLLQHNGTITHLCVGDTSFSDDGLSVLSNGLEAPTCGLQSLDLENKGLSAKGLADLVPKIAHNTSLTSLTLSRNDFSGAGFQGLAAAACSVRELRLSHCHLTGDSLTDGALIIHVP